MDEEWTGDEIPFSEYLREEAYHPAPDPLDPILDVDGMLSSMEAHRLHQIDCYRLAAHTRAAQTGHTSPDLVERSVRLELAAAMRTTEHEAAELMVRGQALVHRYPSALDSLGRGRMTRKHAELLVSLLDAVDVELVPDLVQPAVALAEAEPVGCSGGSFESSSSGCRRRPSWNVTRPPSRSAASCTSPTSTVWRG